MDQMGGMPQEWQNREDLLGGIGDDDDADALNDETFGGGWDDPAPMMGDISDLSAMTLDKAQILQEAAQSVPGAGAAGGGAAGGSGGGDTDVDLLGGPREAHDADGANDPADDDAVGCGLGGQGVLLLVGGAGRRRLGQSAAGCRGCRGGRRGCGGSVGCAAPAGRGRGRGRDGPVCKQHRGGLWGRAA